MTGPHKRPWVRRVKPGIAICIPLHRSADAIVVAEINVIAHANLVTVVKNGRAREGKEQTIEQLDAAPIVVNQRSQAPADARVNAHSGIGKARDI